MLPVYLNTENTEFLKNIVSNSPEASQLNMYIVFEC